MEKRALIAFGLSLAVLFIWQYFFGDLVVKNKQPQQQTQEQSPPATTPPKSAPTQPLPAIPPGTLPQDRVARPEQPFEHWSIDTPLYAMRLVSPGGRVASFKLKNFRQQADPASPPMELVPSQVSGYLPLSVDLLQHQDLQLSTRPFTSSAPATVEISGTAQPQPMSLTTEVNGRVKVTKTFKLNPNTYAMDVEVRLQNLSSETLLDQMGISYYFMPYAAVDKEDSYNPSQLAYYEQGSLTQVSMKDLAKKDTVIKGPATWVGYENNYFIQAVVPSETTGFQIVPRVLDAEKGLVQLVYLTDPFQIESGKEKVINLTMYVGPKDLKRLEEAGHDLVKSVDYGWFTFLAKPLLLVLNGINSVTHNYGVAIILLTVLIKIFFWPLTQKSYESMKKMKKVQPKINEIREKYKDNKEKQNEELMAIYRTHKVNPMGGCLPMALQIPVFFALYRMLNGAVELRHEPFFLWIKDLTAPDRLHVGFDIPYLGGIPVLTILMGISMFLQQKMTPSTGDPRQDQMMLLMPVVFTVFFVNFPAGLVLYWLVNNVLSIAQQYWVNRSGNQ
ncbi:MAG: membrane protein insertase YidC [Acidobacteriota bacterium]